MIRSSAIWVEATIDLEWAFAPITWAAALAIANVAVAWGWKPARWLRRGSALTLVLGCVMLLAESNVRAHVPAWQALAGGRLGLELLAVAAGVALTWASRHRSLPPLRRRKPRRPVAVAIALALLGATSGLAHEAWLIPPSLRSTLSLARGQAEGSPALQSVRGLVGLMVEVLYPSFQTGEVLELAARRGDGPVALAAVLRPRGPDGSPALDVTLVLISLIGDFRGSRVAVAELERWLRWEQAAHKIRVSAAYYLESLGDADGAAYAGELYLRVRSDPAWWADRGDLLRLLVRSAPDKARAAFREMLRSRTAPPSEVLSAFRSLLGSDALEDRAATLDFFIDEDRFARLSASDLPSLRAPMAPLMADLLEDDDPLVRARACKQLVSDEPQARQFHAELWDEVGGYPCRVLQKAPARSRVAASIRRSLALAVLRPPLPPDARLAPLPDDALPSERHAETVRLDDYSGDVRVIAVTPDASSALITGGSSTTEWFLKTRRRLYALTANGADAFAFLPGQPLAVAWKGRYGADAYDTETGERVRSFPPCAQDAPPAPPAIQASRRTGAGAMSPDGTLVATGGDELCLWDGAQGTLILRRPVCSSADDVAPMAAAFSPDGGTLFVACRHEVFGVTTRGAQAGAKLGVLVTPSDSMQWVGPMVALSADGVMRLLIAERSSESAQNDRIALWSTRSKEPGWSIDLGSRGAPARPATTPCSPTTLAGPYAPFAPRSYPGTADRLRPVPGYALSASPSPCRQGASARPWSMALDPGPPMALSSDRERLLVGGHGLCLWRVSNGTLARCLVPPGEAEVTAVAWGPGDAFAIEADRDAPPPATAASTAPFHRVRTWDGESIVLP